MNGADQAFHAASTRRNASLPQVSHTAVWKLRNGQAANPQMKLVAALARTFGVHTGFFSSDFDEKQAGLLHEQAEFLARAAAPGSAVPGSVCSWS